MTFFSSFFFIAVNLELLSENIEDVNFPFTRLPFDWKEPAWYAVAIISQAMMCVGTAGLLSHLISMFIVFSMFFDNMGSDLGDTLQHWDSEIVTSSANRAGIKKTLIEIVSLHLEAQR